LKRGVSTAKKKTVGEILEEQGVIKPRPKEKVEKPKYKFEQEVDLKKIVMNVEKLAAEVNALKEVKFHADERIRELAEKIGELRSLLFQRETSIKEMESKIKFIDDAVSDVEPKKIRKEMEKRKVEIEETELKIERLETMNKEMLKNLRSVEKITENIKSVENLKSMLNKIEKMVSKGEKTRTDIDRLAGKAERFYIEMENRIKEFPKLKIKLEKVDDLTKEITKTIDEINIKIAAFVSKEDLESFKKGVDNVILSNREKLENRIKEIEEVLKIPSEEIISRRDKLKKKKGSISKLLANLEEQYRKAEITKKAYDEIKGKNENLLKKIDEETKKLEGEEVFTLKSLPTIINELESGLSILETKTGGLENKIKSIGEEEIGTTLKTQTEVAKNMLAKLRDVSKKMTELSLKMKFFEILNMLMRMEAARDISFYISELEKTVSEMKSKKLWDDKKDLLTKNLLADIGEAWHQYGYDDIAQIFVDGIKKISPPPVIETAGSETEINEPENINTY